MFYPPFILKSLTFKFCFERLPSFVIQVSQTSGFTRVGVGDGDVDVGMGKEYAGQRVEYQRASSLYLFCKLQMISSPQFLSCLARNHSRLCVLSPPTKPNQSFKEMLSFQNDGNTKKVVGMRISTPQKGE